MPPDIKPSKKKAPLDLHLRVWNRSVAAYVKDQSKIQRRNLAAQVVIMLEQAMQTKEENANGE